MIFSRMMVELRGKAAKEYGSGEKAVHGNSAATPPVLSLPPFPKARVTTMLPKRR